MFEQEYFEKDYTLEDLERIRNMPPVTDEEIDMELVKACIQTEQHPKDVGLEHLTTLYEREIAKCKQQSNN